MDGNNIVVFGKKGFGKTTWLKRYIHENQDKVYFVYDHFKEYTEKEFDCRVFHSIESFLDYDVFYIGTSRIFVFRGEIKYDDFFWMCCKVKNCVAVFDEIDMACRPTNIEPNLYRIIHYGRHLKVGILSASRRPANVSRNLTSQADEIICFRITEPNDLKYISDFCGKDISQVLPSLQIGQFVRYPPSDNLSIVDEEVKMQSTTREETKDSQNEVAER